MASKPKMPPPQPTVRMPLPNDEQALAAKKRAQNALMSSRGRESTDLTGDDADMTTSFLGK
jgi:hypothetical protein